MLRILSHLTQNYISLRNWTNPVIVLCNRVDWQTHQVGPPSFTKSGNHERGRPGKVSGLRQGPPATRRLGATIAPLQALRHRPPGKAKTANRRHAKGRREAG